MATVDSKSEEKKIKSITDHLIKLGEEEAVCGRDPETGAIKMDTRNKILANQIWKHALRGDLKMLNIVLERIEGKVVNRTQTGIDAHIGVTIFDDIKKSMIEAKNQQTIENTQRTIKDD